MTISDQVFFFFFLEQTRGGGGLITGCGSTQVMPMKRLSPPQRLLQWGNGEKTGKRERQRGNKTPRAFVSLLPSSQGPLPHGKTKETSAEERDKKVYPQVRQGANK